MIISAKVALRPKSYGETIFCSAKSLVEHIGDFMKLGKYHPKEDDYYHQLAIIATKIRNYYESGESNNTWLTFVNDDGECIQVEGTFADDNTYRVGMVEMMNSYIADLCNDKKGENPNG